MPSTSAQGTQPARTRLANSCPDRSERNGCGGRTGPSARTAVPIARNSSPPAGNGATVSRTATTPSPPSSAHSCRIRSLALVRASYSDWRRPGASTTVEAIGPPHRPPPGPLRVQPPVCQPGLDVVGGKPRPPPQPPPPQPRPPQ